MRDVTLRRKQFRAMRIPYSAMTSGTQIMTQLVTLAVTFLTLTVTSGTYLGWKPDENRLHDKSNQITASKRYGPSFKSDQVSKVSLFSSFSTRSSFCRKEGGTFQATRLKTELMYFPSSPAAVVKIMARPHRARSHSRSRFGKATSLH